MLAKNGSLVRVLLMKGPDFTPQITELKEPAGALFIELHYALEDPYAWYDGKNILRSKLPEAVREKVQAFRRKLKAG